MDSIEAQAELFSRYLEICNQVLEANKERFPFRQILGAARKEETPRNVEVQIIDDKPQTVFVIHIDQDKISGLMHEECANCGCKGQWRVTRSYLEDVIKNPAEYIKNPAKIDWDWMYAHNNHEAQADFLSKSLHGNSEEHAEHE